MEVGLNGEDEPKRPYKMAYDDEYEALRSTIEDSGKTYKEVAIFLFPHLKIESAYSRLKACLNPDKDDRLTFGQIIAMCKFCDRYDALHFMAHELFHEAPKQKLPEDEKALLMQKFIKAKEDLEKIAGRLEKSF